MRSWPGFPALLSRCAALCWRLARRGRHLARRGRKGVSATTAITVAIAATLSAVALTSTVKTPSATQQVWGGGAVGGTHRVSAETTTTRIVNGRVVPASSSVTLPGRPAKRPARLKLPVQGQVRDQLRPIAARPATTTAGFNQKTSKELTLSKANQVTYANADGTKTTFDFQQPVNYQRANGQWATISTSLVPAGQATTAAPAAPTVPAAPVPSLSPTPASSTDPNPSTNPNTNTNTSASGHTTAAVTRTVPVAGWTEQSAAQPQAFAAFADSPDLVSITLGAGQRVAFGLTGAAHVAGVVQGDTVTYPGALDGADLRFTAGAGLVKEQIILHGTGVPADWTFPLHLTGLTVKKAAHGLLEFRTSNGTPAAFIPAGFMTDANINPRSGSGETSTGVSYQLAGDAIRMHLDTAWLDSKSRVFPVTVDPSVTSVYSNGTAYVETSGTLTSSGPEILAGTWDGGSTVAKSFLSFGNVSSQLAKDTVLGAELGVYNTWSYSCSPRPVYVYPVTQSWSPTSGTAYPGPATSGSAIGSATFATGWTPLGSTTSPCKSKWENIKLNQAGTNLINGWTHGTVADNGLALGTSSTDSYSWKKFSSYGSGTGNPYLAITYTADSASYKLASTHPVKPVEPGVNGQFAIKVTNNGASTWTTSNGYELSYEVYNSAGKEIAAHPVFTPMPSTVAPGATVTVNATVDALPAGSYALDFQMYSGATGANPVSFRTGSGNSLTELGVGLYIQQPPPTVSKVYPPTGSTVPTLQPQLSVAASTGSGTITYSFSITCDPLPGQVCSGAAISSPNLTVPYWTPPAGNLQWNMPYQWRVTATVNGAATTVGPMTITPQVPQPAITSGLGASSGQAYDPETGNFTTSASDAAVASAGPALSIQRTYNSLDPRTAGAFGAGWSSVLDTAVQPESDGNVVATLPDGQEMRFGNDYGGVYSAPPGSPDVLVQNSGGTWTLRDSAGNEYNFTSAGQLSGIINQNNLSQTFTDNSAGQIATVTNPVSGRTLTLTWSTPAGATHPHVASVATQAPASGQSGSSWTYSYTGDDLSQVCGPAASCASYTYATGSHYRSAVLDAAPTAYWQLGDASGTDATDEADANLGSDDGGYANVTLGAAGPVAGSGETAAGFNGTSSSVSQPASLISNGTDVSVELWFKAANAKASGVLYSYDSDALSNAKGNTDHHTPALYVGGNGQLYGEFWNGSVDPIHTSTSVTDGKWHYVVLSGDSTSQALYLDGTKVGTLGGQINQMSQTVDTIGAGFWQDGWPNAYLTSGTTQNKTAIGYFSGTIAQAAVYPYALSQDVVSQHESLATAASPELTQVTLPSGKTYQSASYDPATGRLASYTDQNGGQWTIANPIATGYPSTANYVGQVVRGVTVTDPAGRNQVYSYDALNGGRLISYGNGVDQARTFGYDPSGFVASVTDADGNLVCLSNDIHGNTLTRTWYPVSPGTVGGGTGTVTNCGGSTTSSATCTSSGAPCTTFYSYYYNPANPLDPKNDELTGERDGRSASATDSTYLTSYGYNSMGQLTAQTTPATSDFPAGRTTAYAYSAGTEAGYGGGTIPAGLLLSTTTPGGAVTSYAYYSDGDLAKVTEPSGRSTVYSYDTLGRPATGTVYTSGDPGGQTTSYTYTATDQPLTVGYPGVPNPLTKVTHTLQDAYAYDADGNLTSLTASDTTGGDPARVTSYSYDDHDQVATVTEPGGATSGGSAQSGGAASADPAGATTGYSHDAFGNVTSVTDPDGNTDRYSYNEYNKVTQVQQYTPSASETTPVANCATPATQDSDGGCDLTLDSYSYDPAGLLAAQTDAMGRTTNYSYNTDEQLIAATTTDGSVTPTTGRRTTWTYDGAGNLVSTAVSAMSGGAVGTSTVTSYAVDAAGRLASTVADPGSGTGYANRSTSYTYNADNDVTSVTAGGSSPSVTAYGYDGAGDMSSKTVQDGSSSLQTTWTYNQSSQPLTETAPAGNASGATAADYTTSYGYDQAGHLSTVTGPPVQTQTYPAPVPATTRPVTSYGYDTFGDQTQAQDPDGNTTTDGYDGNGRVTSVTNPSYTPPGGSAPVTGTSNYGYDEDGNLTSVTDPAGNSTLYEYDSLGDLTSVTQPQLPGQSGPGTWTYGYDGDGEQLSATDPAGDTTKATYDYFGNKATSTDALTNTTSYAHDYLGDLTKTTSPDGVVTSSSYDHLGELASTADAAGDTTSYAYTGLGQVAKVTSPDGTYTQNGYDQAGNLTSVTDDNAAGSAQRSESFGYDSDGNQTSADDWNGDTTRFAYNAANQLTGEVQPVSASSSISKAYGYDPAGNQTAVTSGNGNTTWTTYNARNQPESVIEPSTPSASAPSARTWTTSYDADGNPVSVSQPGGITQAYTYDPLGDVLSESGSGAAAQTPTQSFGYDLDGRMTSASAPGGTNSFSYNADSQLTGASGPSGTSSYAYNGDGLVSSETDTAGTTSYSYDPADRLATDSDPLTGATLSYSYNADSQPTSIGYSVSGASGPKQTFGYDSQQRLASDTVTSASGTTLAAEGYGYDNDGDLTSLTTAGLTTAGLTTAGSTSYGYDQADRLTSATGGGSSTSYGYDADGNLTSSGGTSYGYDAQDQVTSAATSSGTTGYSYTQSGALASITPPSGGAQAYTSDAFGQTATAPGGISYGYDALGRLVSRSTSAGSTSLSYLGAGSTLAADGSSSYSYTPSGALTGTQASGGTGYAAMTDQHGDVVATFGTTAGTSALAGSASYSPYGTASTSGTMPAAGYQGDYTDPSTGQVNMSARWYNPGTGSFDSNDTVTGSPLSSTVDGNPYAYADGNPLTGTDPTGHFCFTCVRGGLVLGGETGAEVGVETGPWDAVATLGGALIGGAIAVWAGGHSSSAPYNDPNATPNYPNYRFHPYIDTSGNAGDNYPNFRFHPYVPFYPGSSSYPAPPGIGGGYGGDYSGGYGYGGYGYGGTSSATGTWSGVTGSAPYIPAPPPPPPPPPQDCYAGPNPTCTPPAAPKSMRDAQHITSQVPIVTSASTLLGGPNKIIELAQPSRAAVQGTTPDPDGNDNPATQSGADAADISAPIAQVDTPAAPQPAAGGIGKGDGGNNLPPLGNACSDPGNGDNQAAEDGSDQPPLFIQTPYDLAVQSSEPAALAARDEVLRGATLYKGGSATSLPPGESQYFALEDPGSPGYAARYGIPPMNLPFDWIAQGTLKPGAPFITRPAPGVEYNSGGAIEVVTDPGSFDTGGAC